MNRSSSSSIKGIQTLRDRSVSFGFPRVLDFRRFGMLLTGPMDLHDLTVNELRRAAAIKQQIEDLNKELERILGAPGKSGAALNSKRTVSAAARKRMAAAQKARWAKLQGAKPAAASRKRVAKAKKKMSPATRAKLSSKLKAYWAAKKTKK